MLKTYNIKYIFLFIFFIFLSVLYVFISIYYESTSYHDKNKNNFIKTIDRICLNKEIAIVPVEKCNCFTKFILNEFKIYAVHKEKVVFEQDKLKVQIENLLKVDRYINELNYLCKLNIETSIKSTSQ